MWCSKGGGQGVGGGCLLPCPKAVKGITKILCDGQKHRQKCKGKWLICKNCQFHWSKSSNECTENERFLLCWCDISRSSLTFSHFSAGLIMPRAISYFKCANIYTVRWQPVYILNIWAAASKLPFWSVLVAHGFKSKLVCICIWAHAHTGRSKLA